MDIGDRVHLAEALLLQRGAAEIDHPGGRLFAHLRRVAALLRAWGATDDLQLAGLCHACYGTDGFPVALMRLDERVLLGEAIGARAEAWVFLYARAARSATYPVLGRGGPLTFRDRFSGGSFAVSDEDAAAFVELTAANELDLLQVVPAFREAVGPQLRALFARARRHLSDPAWAAWAA